MLVKIKICGLKTLSEINCAVDYGASWYGLIFFRGSPRNIDLKAAEKLVAKTPKQIEPVAVTVNPSKNEIQELFNIGIKNIQLHGKESVKFCEDIHNKFKIKVFKAISIKKKNDIALANKYKDCSDWILFDYKDDYQLGGTGKAFNWNVLKNINLNFNWILSGGLDYNNVKKAISITNAKAVDVSSGVEERKGIKSTELIKKFCNSVYN